MTKAQKLIELGTPPEVAKELVTPNTEVAALTPVTTADATDLATAQELANANKAKINAIIAALNA